MQTSDKYQVLPIYMQTSFSLKNGQTCCLIAIVRVATEKTRINLKFDVFWYENQECFYAEKTFLSEKEIGIK